MEQEELRKLEAQCIQENAPGCTAGCPVHVDVRGMTAAVARGDFVGAAGIFKRSVPFPGIIARVCDHPCQTVCKRGEAGSPIAVRPLEKACLDWGEQAAEKVAVLPRKERRAAIVGAGLSGLTAAFDLARKGYPVTVFEKEDQPGGSLWNLAEEDLPRRAMLQDFEKLAAVGVEFKFRRMVGHDITLSEVRESADVVYLAIGAQPAGTFELQLDREGKIAIDPISFATSETGVFAGGSLLRNPDQGSPIQSIADGRRAAVSIDRYLQRVSLTAARVNEGSYPTRLFTNIEGVPPLSTVPMENPAEGYSKDEAIREAQRCLQCQCLECVKVCEYLRSFGSYPKKYVREIYNNLAIVMGHRHANKLINSCSLCGLCREVCPEDLHMGLVCKSAREVLVKTGKMPPSAHDFPIRDMQFSNSDLSAMARHQPGTSKSTYLFFPGCQLSASSPEHVKDVYRLLSEQVTGGVGIMLRCCGAPADWSGRIEMFQETMNDFLAHYRQLGTPRLILACSTCYEVFKTHLPNVQIASLWEVLDQLGLLPAAVSDHPGRPPFAVHDACTTRHETHIQQSVRHIIDRLGFNVEELSLSAARTECCGYGGLMFFANPDLAKAVIQRRISESPLDYVAYCAICRDYLASRGKRTVHLLDLISGSDLDQAANRPSPGYSQRHEHRARLKRSLLKDLWGEQLPENEDIATIQLSIPEGVREIMESRLILEEDLRQVIDHAEGAGTKLLNPESGRFLAHFKPASVTYWVEYSTDGDTFVIHNTYSHRMEIVEEFKP